MTQTAVERLAKLLWATDLTIGVAESCTGGLLSSELTDVPGSSRYYAGGVIAYADHVKQQLLGVKANTLLAHGAVSEMVALQMARGARSLFAADIGIGITGIAGPGGGTAEKPVGLVFIGLAAGADEICKRYVWDGDRSQNKADSVDAAICLIREYLEEAYG